MCSCYPAANERPCRPLEDEEINGRFDISDPGRRRLKRLRLGSMGGERAKGCFSLRQFGNFLLGTLVKLNYRFLFRGPDIS